MSNIYGIMTCGIEKYIGLKIIDVESNEIYKEDEENIIEIKKEKKIFCPECGTSKNIETDNSCLNCGTKIKR